MLEFAFCFSVSLLMKLFLHPCKFNDIINLNREITTLKLQIVVINDVMNTGGVLCIPLPTLMHVILQLKHSWEIQKEGMMRHIINEKNY